LDRTSLNSSITRTILSWSLEHISWWWMATTGLKRETSSLSSQPPTTATDVEMKRRSWKSMSTWSTLCKSSLIFSL
jgi:hypothetical protein